MEFLTAPIPIRAFGDRNMNSSDAHNMMLRNVITQKAKNRFIKNGQFVAESVYATKTKSTIQ